jgi:ribosomal protein S14
MSKVSYSEKKKEQYYDRKQRHVCVRCGKPDAGTENGYAYCRECLDYQANQDAQYQSKEVYYINLRRRMKKRYYERKAAGLCVICGKESRPGKIYCQRCSDRQYNSQRNRKRKERQNENVIS